MLKKTLMAIFVAVFAFVAHDALAQSGKPAQRSITKLAGDVYQFKNNFHKSVFMVTPKGIIFMDPINKGASTWLKAELKKRFNQPVKYVIYSHDHGDHISGGEIFADTAIFVAHEQAKKDIIGEKRATPVPDLTFKDEMTIELGGKTVELIYNGRNHSDNMIVARFPTEKILHTVDFVGVKGLPFRDFPDSYINDWIESLKKVENIDFDILSTGHGANGTKADVVAYRGYITELRDAVLAGARAGQSLEQLLASIKMEKYSGWGRYKQFLPLNIKGMYAQVQMTRRGNPRR